MSRHIYLQSDELEGLWPLKSDDLVPEPGRLIRIVNYQHGLHLPTSSVRPSFSAEGFRQGYIEHSPVTVDRALDSCSPYLFRAMLNRTVLKSVQIVSCEMVKDSKTDDKSFPKPLWIIRMGHVMISDLRYGPVESVGNGESITFQYQSINWFFRPVSLDTRIEASTPHTAGWDGKLNKAVDAGVADLEDTFSSLMNIIKDT